MGLGDMSKEDAQKELVQLLHKAAPHMEGYVIQQWKTRTKANGKMYYIITTSCFHGMFTFLDTGKGRKSQLRSVGR